MVLELIGEPCNMSYDSLVTSIEMAIDCSDISYRGRELIKEALKRLGNAERKRDEQKRQ